MSGGSMPSLGQSVDDLPEKVSERLLLTRDSTGSVAFHAVVIDVLLEKTTKTLLVGAALIGYQPVHRLFEVFNPSFPHSIGGGDVNDSERICAPDIDNNRAYCGRKNKNTDEWSRVTCPDCHAAARADTGAKR